MRYRLNEGACQAMKGATKSSQEPVNYRVLCPVHGGKTKTLSVGLAQDGYAMWHCFAGCDKTLVRDSLLGLGILEPQAAWEIEQKETRESQERRASEQKRKDDHRAWMRSIWSAGIPIKDTPGQAYFASRGIRFSDLPAPPVNIRWHEKRHEIVAMISRGAGATGLHITRPHPVKPQVTSRKMHGSVKGGAVRLITLGKTLNLAEGIETALAAAVLTSGGVWATLSASGMDTLQVSDIPQSVTSVRIMADFDGTGIKAAELLEKRLKQAGFIASLHIPGQPEYYRHDWLDYLNDKEGK